MLRHLLIAEDHPICFAALKIAAHNRDSAILVESTESLASTVQRLSERDFSALLLDLGLKDSEGVVNLKIIRDKFPRLPILVVSATDDLAVRRRTRAFGAQGFLPKTATLEEMGDAIISIMDGGLHFDAIAEEDTSEADFLSDLSLAQIRVMKELLNGASNKVIAFNLNISESTVKSHLNSIFQILNVSNRSQAVLKFSELVER